MRIGIASLAFLPGVGIVDQARAIARLGFTRLDLRIAADDGLAPTASFDQAVVLRQQLAALGVNLGCLYAYPGLDAAGLRYLCRLAGQLGADQIRVMAGRVGPERCKDLLTEVLVGDEQGPLLVVQNHATSSLDLADAVAVVSTINHPRVRLATSPDHEVIHGRWTADLFRAALPWTETWVWNDLRREGGHWVHCLPGDGDLPWADITAHLVDDDRTVITCKWERRWHPELPAVEIALPAYRAHIHGLFRSHPHSG